MIYFLDFDRTIFDYDCFENKFLFPQEIFKPLILKAHKFEKGSPERARMWREVARILEAGETQLHSNDLSECVFSDAFTFFEQHGDNIVIVTAGSEDFQKFKIDSSMFSCTWRDTLYVGNQDKGSAIQSWLKGSQEKAVFVDDSLWQIESVEKECPWIALYHIHRSGTEKEGKYPVIKNFNDLKI